MMATLAAWPLGLSMLGGCTTAARMWEAGALDQIKGANDNAARHLEGWRMRVARRRDSA
jgi:hypothetical protein